MGTALRRIPIDRVPKGQARILRVNLSGKRTELFDNVFARVTASAVIRFLLDKRVFPRLPLVKGAVDVCRLRDCIIARVKRVSQYYYFDVTAKYKNRVSPFGRSIRTIPPSLPLGKLTSLYQREADKPPYNSQFYLYY